MALFKCKMCGGTLETDDKSVATCEYCGTQQTLPRADDDQRAAAFNRGNHFRRIGEFDKALAVYERIVRDDDTDAEAHWSAHCADLVLNMWKIRPHMSICLPATGQVLTTSWRMWTT